MTTQRREVAAKEGFVGFARKAVLRSTMAFLVGLASPALFARVARAAKAELSRDQASTVVMSYLNSKGYKTDSSRFGLDDEPRVPDSPGFFMFHASYYTTASLIDMGAYAVDRQTLALWDRDKCQELKSKALAQVQKKLRRKARLPSPTRTDAADSRPCS